MSYEIKPGNLFTHAPRKAILTHACNAQGRWGRGIALEMKHKFPTAFAHYVKYCQARDTGFPGGPNRAKCGSSFIAIDQKLIGCLITSWQWSPPDTPEDILGYTKTAAKSLIEQAVASYPGYEIHSCKINSNLFQVDWAKTESVIKKVLEDTGDKMKWVVWDYERFKATTTTPSNYPPK